MSHGVLALGVAVICVSGHVWYLPACIDLRASQDRPGSRRPAAAAVLTGWTFAAATMLLLLAPVARHVVAGVAAAGLAATVTLAARAWLRRREERREAESRWAALFPMPTATPARHTEDER
ncbi:hypothetical protein [Streptomyces sp. NPDC014734]|uniref:hypothetical protein n=1 Tax=Streptomyces sp. NPDC014734 TaxID=3364886 RepID=UPI0036F867AA